MHSMFDCAVMRVKWQIRYFFTWCFVGDKAMVYMLCNLYWANKCNVISVYSDVLAMNQCLLCYLSGHNRPSAKAFTDLVDWRAQLNTAGWTLRSVDDEKNIMATHTFGMLNLQRCFGKCKWKTQVEGTVIPRGNAGYCSPGNVCYMSCCRDDLQRRHWSVLFCFFSCQSL